ncbi:MAG: imidazole glycerol phosphate synthase subunit HisH [Aestuariivirga sp.]
MPSRIAIVDYGSGNLHSAAKAFERASQEAATGHEILVTADPDQVRKAERIVLPGVGTFRDCRDGLRAVPGMWTTLVDEVAKGKPFLGICVGMQLMADRGHEHEVTEGFGWIAGDVRRIAPADPALKIPHMGWNTLNLVRPHALLKDIAPGLHAYFVHSYHMELRDPSNLIATSSYAQEITAIVGRDNIAGTQFHPEKSQKLGLALIANFLRWRP